MKYTEQNYLYKLYSFPIYIVSQLDINEQFILQVKGEIFITL